MKNHDKHCTFCGKLLTMPRVTMAPMKNIFYELLLYELNGESNQVCRKFVCCGCSDKLKKDMK